MYLPEDIDDILRNTENTMLEYKEARSNFSDGDRSDYCAAIANMGGGRLLLGVANDKNIVGTSVYQGTINQISQQVYQQIGITVTIEDVFHPKGRVVILDIPSRPVGQRGRRNGGKYIYPIRRGESLGEMDDVMTREILNEVQPDFSSSIVESLTLGDLDEGAVENFKKRRAEKTGFVHYGAFHILAFMMKFGIRLMLEIYVCHIKRALFSRKYWLLTKKLVVKR